MAWIERLGTHSIRSSPHADRVLSVLAAALEAADPASAILRAFQHEAGRISIQGREYRLSDYGKVYCLALGKAAVPMAESLWRALGERMADSLVITKHSAGASLPSITIMQGGHPVPDERSLAAGRAVLDFIGQVRAPDLLFCLISGGGSALVAAPADGVTLAALQDLTAGLIASGASISEINAVRRRLDKLKAGGLARRAAPAQMVSLILSDVIDNSLESIASGPTAPDPTTRDRALAVVRRYGLLKSLSPEIRRALEAGMETPKPGDPIFDHVHNVVVGSNLNAAQSALRQAAQEGFHPYLLHAELQGEAARVGFDLSGELRWAANRGEPVPRPACLIAGGETTVTLQGTGQGGRNQELALAAVTALADFPDVMLIALATDGEDGPTDAAGAAVTGGSFQRATALGLNPADFMRRNDSYNFFAALDDLLKPGPTGTNVNDLTFLFAF